MSCSGRRAADDDRRRLDRGGTGGGARLPGRKGRHVMQDDPDIAQPAPDIAEVAS